MSSSTQAYGEAWYWDKRYEQESGPFDWYQKYPSLSPLLHLYIPTSSHPTTTSVLVVGCGTSAFSEGMVDDGYGDVVNIDISSVAIETMRERYSNRPQLKCVGGMARDSSGSWIRGFLECIGQASPLTTGIWAIYHGLELAWDLLAPKISLLIWTFITFRESADDLSPHLLQDMKDIKMDVRDMSAFQSGSFGAVIDKGTLDSLLCGHNSRENAAKMLEEVDRVLKANGVYILITYGAPTYRLHLLREAHSWSIKLHVIGKGFLEASSEHQTQELTSPVPLNYDTGSTLGKNPDVHYIYVCIKDDSKVRL